MIKAVLTKPLDGEPEGTPRDLSQADRALVEGVGANTRARRMAVIQSAGGVRPGRELDQGHHGISTTCRQPHGWFFFLMSPGTGREAG